MRKNIKKWLRFAALACMVACAALVFAACGRDGLSDVNPYDTGARDFGFTVNRMDVTMTAHKDRTVEVEETVAVTYHQTKHGILRDIPVNSGERVRDLTVSGDPYSVSHTGNDLVTVKIGSETRTYRAGESATYVIKYTLIVPKMSKAPDSFTMNVIGQGWATEIERATVTIHLPEPIVSEGGTLAARYFVGRYGTSDDSGARVRAEYADSNKTVKLTVLPQSGQALDAFEGVTVALDMPKGTLGAHVETELLVTLFAGLVVAAAAVLLKIFAGRNDPVMPVVNFYPPKDESGKEMTPVQMGCIIDHSCSASDVTSMIFYWASKGYLRLEEQDNDMKMVKLKDLPASATAYEKKMFDKIFAAGDETTTKELQNTFYTTMTSVQSSVTREYNGKLYSKKVTGLSFLTLGLTVLYVLAMVFFGYLRVSRTYYNFWGFLSLVPLFLMYVFGLYLAYNHFKMTPKKRLGLYLLYGAVALILAGFTTFFVKGDVMGVAEKILLALFTAVAGVTAPFIIKRTKFYNDNLNQILGFRNFIRDAEKERLELLLKENPQYYYDVLPYANVLGVSDIWQDKFKNLTIEPPSYYYSPVDTIFSIMIFNRFYRMASTSFQTNAVSRPAQSSRSGGGFGGGFGGGGGGGFSGGGFGGGGGRSW